VDAIEEKEEIVYSVQGEEGELSNKQEKRAASPREKLRT